MADNWKIVQEAILAFNMHVPDMALCREKLFNLLSSKAWTNYSPPIGDECKPASFSEWVTAKVPRGLDTTVSNLEEIAKGDDDLLVLLDKTIQRPLGANQHTKGVDNSHTQRPDGTRKLTGRRKLRKDRPDLDALVESGQLSTHAAMVQAGFRHKRFTVPNANKPDSIVATLRRQLDPEVLSMVTKLLAEGE